MYVNCVTITILPNRGGAFVDLTREWHRNVEADRGSFHCDLLRPAGTPVESETETFLLYEVYRTAEDLDRMQQSDAYNAWKSAVTPLLVNQRGARYFSVYPEDWPEVALESEAAPPAVPDPSSPREESGMRREMIVFVSYENQTSPEALARDLAESLRIEPVEMGVDMFTGGCELRTPYDASLLAEIKAFLAERRIVHDISFI